MLINRCVLRGGGGLQQLHPRAVRAEHPFGLWLARVGKFTANGEPPTYQAIKQLTWNFCAQKWWLQRSLKCDSCPHGLDCNNTHRHGMVKLKWMFLVSSIGWGFIPTRLPSCWSPRGQVTHSWLQPHPILLWFMTNSQLNNTSLLFLFSGLVSEPSC